MRLEKVIATIERLRSLDDSILGSAGTKLLLNLVPDDLVLNYLISRLPVGDQEKELILSKIASYLNEQNKTVAEVIFNKESLAFLKAALEVANDIIKIWEDENEKVSENRGRLRSSGEFRVSNVDYGGDSTV